MIGHQFGKGTVSLKWEKMTNSDNKTIDEVWPAAPQKYSEKTTSQTYACVQNFLVVGIIETTELIVYVYWVY